MELKSGYGLDPDGYIISDVSMDKIDLRYLPCIEETVDWLKNLYQQQLQCLSLRQRAKRRRCSYKIRFRYYSYVSH